MFDIISPTPAAVNKAPSAANNWGNIAVEPTAWNILLLSSKNSLGLALVNINVVIKATIDAIPTAATPEISVNWAIINATKAIINDGINIFTPISFDFKLAKVVSKSFKVPILIWLKAAKAPITTINEPVITEGITSPSINIIPSIPQNKDVPYLVLWFLSFKVNIIVSIKNKPSMM